MSRELEAFAEWFAREVPPGTLISDPHWWAPRILRAALAAHREAVPDVLFDGYAVFHALTKDAKRRTSPENVSDVLDAVVRLLRALPPAPAAEPKLCRICNDLGPESPPYLCATHKAEFQEWKAAAEVGK